MSDGRFVICPFGQRDLHDIEPKCERLGIQSRQVGFKGARQGVLLPPIDRIIPPHEGSGAACLHLHENKDIPILPDQVDLFSVVARVAPVRRENAKARVTTEPVRGQSFCAGAGPVRSAA